MGSIHIVPNQAYEDYYINVVIDSSTVNKGLEQAILISLSYLVVAASILVFVVNTMEKQVGGGREGYYRFRDRSEQRTCIRGIY